MKLEPVEKRYAQPYEQALRAQWEKDLSSYKKPARTDPISGRSGHLLCSSETDTALGYILFVDGKIKSGSRSVEIEFLEDDPELMRKATLHMKTAEGFHVYYKHRGFWYGVPKHFDNLSDAMPYLQGGIRLIVEYRFTKPPTK